MGYDQYIVPDTELSNPLLVAFLYLALANYVLTPLVPLFEFFFKNSKVKTTHNTFRDCRLHFFRQPFSKQLYVSI